MPTGNKQSLAGRVGTVLPWLWLLGAWVFGVVFMLLYGRSLLDSDMASEMVLAAQLNREGGILSANWYYSTELRVFCQQLLFKLGLWAFPHNWHAARTLAQAILSALTAVSALYFFYGASLRKSAPWLAGALLCPFGFWQLFHCVFGGFYFVHMIFVMLSMGLVARYNIGRGLDTGAVLSASDGRLGALPALEELLEAQPEETELRQAVETLRDSARWQAAHWQTWSVAAWRGQWQERKPPGQRLPSGRLPLCSEGAGAEKGEAAAGIYRTRSVVHGDGYQAGGAATVLHPGPGGHLTRSGGADEIKAAVERHILPAVGPAGASGGTVGQRVVGPSVEQTIGV